MACVEDAHANTELPLPDLAVDAGSDKEGGLIHLTFQAAESFYRVECQNAGVNTNNTFLKQLIGGVTVFNFDNGYMGGRGIVPILSTLQRLPVVELSMRNCKITTDDVGLIYQTFVSHDTLRKIDLRGVTLTVASARKLLALAVQNQRLTEILIDKGTPKYFYIQKQCISNDNATVIASRCLLCGTPIVYAQDQKIESRLLLSFDVALNTLQPAVTGVALQVMFRCLLACCEVSDGVLFLCSGKCQMQLTNDIVIAMRAVVSEWYFNDVAVYPRNSVLRRCVVDTLKILKAKAKKEVNDVVSAATAGGCNAAVYAVSDTENGKDTDVYYSKKGVDRKYNDDNDDDDDDDDRSSTYKECDAVLEECTICGAHAMCVENSALVAMRQIFEELRGGFLLRPSVLLRVAKLMLLYTEMRSCSKDCIIHLVRYGLYGYGGVLQSRTISSHPRVSSLNVSLKYLPYEEFAIIDFSAAHVDELEEEDTSCALTVASAMSDIDGVTIDPYMIFAFGRYFAKLPPEALGMELRNACEAVQIVGCLPVNMAPFDRRKQRLPRRMYVSLDKWGKHVNMDAVMRVAFSRKREGLYVIDGPHGNLFDNIQAALWAFRKQRRAVLIAIHFSFDWLTLPNGVVPNESSLKRSFLTTFKIVGQTVIDNTIYAICQGNFGPSFGNHGFFYFPRGIINLHASGDAFIFVDSTVYDLLKGQGKTLYAAQVLPNEAVSLVEQFPLLQKVFYCLYEALNWEKRNLMECTRDICKEISNIPLSMFDLLNSCNRNASENQMEILKKIRRYSFTDPSRSILLFYIYEVLGPLATSWIYCLLQRFSKQPPLSVFIREAAESLERDDVRRRQVQDQWVLLVAAKKTAAKAPERPAVRFAKKGTLRRFVKKMEKKSCKETRDTFFAKLEQHWAAERESVERLKELQGNNNIGLGVGSSLIKTAMALNDTTAIETRSLMPGKAASIPMELVGHSWHSVRLCNADGQLGDYALFFIKNYVCCLTLANQAIVVPLTPIFKSDFGNNFPFSSGFDCALNSPVNPRVAYFFSGEQWFQWDTYQQVCTGGPFKLRLHKQFEALPNDFLCGIDAAIPVPNTSCIFFFSQLKYAVFDIVNQRPLGRVRRVDMLETCEADVPTFNSSLSKLFPNGPMTTMLQSLEEKKRKDKGEENVNVEGDLQKDKMSVMLIGRDGNVAIVYSFFDPMLKGTADELLTLPVSSLSRLPLVFRQMTTAALQTVCKEVLYAECKRSGVVVNNAFNGCMRSFSTITSTFSKKMGDPDALLFIKRRDASCSLMPLLRDEVVFFQTEESMLGEPPQVIEIDHGSACQVAFSVLVLVLDTSCIDTRIFEVAPIEVVVESSGDGIMYIRHTHFVATPFVTAVCWGEAHSARFWRITFLTRLPVSTGIVRTLWYEATRIPRSIPLSPAISYVPLASAEVKITAPRVFCSPEELLKPFVSEYVFASPLAGGWLPKHCILPIFFNDKMSCLFFCGSNFVEFDCESKSVLTHRAISLAAHPAFSNLPHPFLMGFNAVFYPNRLKQHIVALLHDNEIILWNISTGCYEESIDDRTPDLFFKGLPWKLEEVDDIVQIWDKAGEFFLIRRLQVLRWNINAMKLVEGPMWLKDCLYLYHPEFDGEQILCATSFPSAPRRFYVFSGERVAAQTVADNTILEKVGPLHVRHFDFFSSITWYLKWGDRRHETVIEIDFKEEQPLLTGMQMHSSESSDDQWLIEYSDDGINWCTAGCHTQSSAVSLTMWSLLSLKNSSHRLWRLLTDSSGKVEVKHNKPPLYMSIVFFTLPSIPCRQLAERISLSGTLNGPMSALFVDEKANVAFEDLTDSRDDNTPPPPHHITLDYGETNLPELMGFSCQSTGTRHNSVWTVLCSNNGEQWETCGTWRCRFRHLKVAWRPRASRRYWRIELRTFDFNALFENFCFFEYTGPSLFLENSSPIGDGWDQSVMWEKSVSADYKVPPVMLSVCVGSAVILDTKKAGAHVVGVRLLGSGQQSGSTEFVVECSSNAVQWQPLNTKFLLRGNAAQVAWQCGDYFRFWRLRVVQHIGQSFLALNAICFEISGPSLYHELVPKNTLVVGNLTGLELNLGDDPKEVVAVEAVLPPKSKYVVEKLSIDGSAWEEVAIVENNDIIQLQTVRQGWTPRGVSSNWRMRPVLFNDAIDGNSNHTANISAQCDQEENGGVCVKWYSFTQKAMIEAKAIDDHNVQVITSGFLEEQDAKRLMDNVTSTVVLRPIEGVTTAFVLWVFDKQRTPFFNYVYFKANIYIAADPELSSFTLTDPLQRSRGLSISRTAQNRFEPLRSYGASVSFLRSTKEDAVVKNTIVEKKPLTVVVEISDNGINYVPIAEQCVSNFGNALSWNNATSAQYWRLRFKGISKARSFVLYKVAWLVERGVIAVPALQGQGVLLSQSVHNTWQTAACNYEEEFCETSREGYDQAKSVVSGLRESDDIELHGRLAQRVTYLKEEFIKLVGRIFKEASKDKNPPDNKFISIGRPLNNDIMYLLYKAAVYYNSNIDDLNALISHPMLFSRDVKRSTSTSWWFYPSFEQNGTLVESFYGFHNVRASFVVLWSLSLQIQKNTDLLFGPLITPLSPHIATVLVVVNILHTNWVAAEHFPNLPLLYHAGFSGKPMVIAFALNQITFTSRYNLLIPGAEPFTACHPFKLYPGVNFIQRMPLKNCVCPVFDCLQMLYSKEFLAKYETEVVFTSPAMSSDVAIVRFTLPGEGIDFGIPGLTIGSIEFEVQLVLEENLRFLKNNNPILISYNLEKGSQMVMFVTHESFFNRLNSDEPPMPISLAGCINAIEGKIKVCGVSRNAHFSVSHCFQDAFLTNMNVSFEVSLLGTTPRSFLKPALTVEGSLVTSLCGNYKCCLISSSVENSYEYISLQVIALQLTKLIRLGNYILGFSTQSKDIEWLSTVPIYLSLTLESFYPETKFSGRGAMEFAGFQGDAEAVISLTGILITAKFTSMQIGGILLHGKSPDDTVVVKISTSANAMSMIRMDGYSCLLASNPYPTRLEIGIEGVMCVSFGVFYDVCIEEDSLFPSGAHAQVTISKSVITECLLELLQETPLIIAILAKGIPFSFDVVEVVVDECCLKRQFLSFVVCGVLFGSRFEVVANAISPDNTLQEAHRICESLLSRIVEQCDVPLWTSYKMISGCPASAEETDQEEGAGAGGVSVAIGDGVAFNVRVLREKSLLDACKKEKKGFLGFWATCECEKHEVIFHEEFGALSHYESKKNKT